MELAQSLLPLASSMIYNAQRTAKAAERAALVAQLRNEHPELIAPSPEVDSLIAAAKNIRTQLKAAFPGVKFRVTTSRFSMGDSLRVAWTDGPAASRVDEIVDRYQAGSFDGMTDCYEYSRSPWPEAFGDAKYVSTSRDFSPEVTTWANEPAGWDERRERWNIIGALSIKAVKKAES